MKQVEKKKGGSASFFLLEQTIREYDSFRNYSFAPPKLKVKLNPCCFLFATLSTALNP